MAAHRIRVATGTRAANLAGRERVGRPFALLFVVQALNAFNDNLFKNALVVLVAFRTEGGGAVLVALSGGIFLLPYLFSVPAGQLADKIDKSRLILWSQLGAVATMGAGAVALLSGSVPALLAVLFGLGVHAAFFGPLKYGVLPEILPPASLLGGNALVEAGTFVAILLGTVAGGVLIGTGDGAAIVGIAGLLVALAGLAAAFALPRLPAADPALRIGANVLAETGAVLRAAQANRPVWISVLALSWFWALGATFLAQFPVLARTAFGADNRVVTLLLAAFAMGVGFGSIAAGRLRSRPAAAAVALSVCTAGFAALCRLPAASGWSSPAAMLGSPPGAIALACLFGASVAGGLYSVPLYALLQRAAGPAARARMVAASNVANALFIVGSAALVAVAAARGVSPTGILVVTAALNLGAAALLSRALRATIDA